jgi:hypothetical protein
MTRPTRVAVVAAAVAAALTLPGCEPSTNEQPLCRHPSPLTLMAESVRTASLVPCVASLPVGWSFAGFTANERYATFDLEREVAEGGVAQVRLSGACETDGLRRVNSDHAGVDEYTSISDDAIRRTWMFLFEGGCVRLRVALPSSQSTGPSEVIHDAIAFMSADGLGPTPGE